MSQEQYELIRTSLNDGSIQKGMPYEEVDNLLGPAQRRVMDVWTYYAGSVNYLSGEGLGEKWQFNFTNGKLKSIYYFAPGIFGWRNVLKEDQPKAKD